MASSHLGSSANSFPSMKPGSRLILPEREDYAVVTLVRRDRDGSSYSLLLRTVSVRFDEEVFRSLNTHHLHMTLAFTGKRTNLKVAENKMLLATERSEQVFWG